MQFERLVRVDDPSLGSSCVVCSKPLGSSRFVSFSMKEQEVSLHAHNSCLDCPHNQLRHLDARWTDDKKTTLSVKLEHVVHCSCGNFACNSCHLPFGFRLDFVQVESIRPLELYHADCLPDQSCTTCGKGANLTGFRMRKVDGKLVHPHCVA